MLITFGGKNVDQRYAAVDGGEYVDDPHFWEKGSSTGFDVVTDDPLKPISS
jgi:hypothetical protein